MKVFSCSSDFDYSWDEVSTGNWQKYSPWNKKAPHVIAVDTLSRTVDAATGILRTERLITTKQESPRWIKALLGDCETSLVYETSYVDPAAKTVTLCSHNLTWTNILSVRETVTYSPSKTSPLTKTLMTQRAEITAIAGGWERIKNKIESFSVERFQQNAENGKAGFEMVLARAREVFQEERNSTMAKQAAIA
ncbi:MSF1-domain-containing protein [Microthyrium microscopicum]|uniref:MSF1-domain-containing protein n=1 Tax=Microthyrium microscopicum TaxID=703497 RepID=A0A6A6UQZ7_9PEZI|nr:MSF1-domain-containing protein [Microthyrium microscopicum]